LDLFAQRMRFEAMADIQPTLEDLRDKATPAWLWDAARGRLVWANKTGVAAFDASNLFDLIDRAFDPQEQGVSRVKDLARELERGKSTKALLHFPSTGSAVPFECRCWLHALADGRAGILLVQEPERPKLSVTPDVLAAKVVEGLPLAVLVLNSEGMFLHGNTAAQKLLDGDHPTSLADFLTSPERASKLLARLAASSIFTTTEHVGQRDYKCVFTRGADETVTLLLEDVTERRALEKDMLSRQIEALDAKVAAAAEQGVAKPTAEPSAFETLGKSIEEAVKAQNVEPVIITAEPEPALPVATDDKIIPLPIRVPFVPDAVRQSLERTGKAILVGRQGEGLFATRQAATILGFEDVSGLFSSPSLWADLFNASSGAVLALVNASGETDSFAVTRAHIPWQNGRADQFVLQPSQAGVAAVNATVVAPPAVVITAPAPELVDAPAPIPEVVATPVVVVDPETAIAYEELKSILDVATDGIITLDTESQILSFSAGAEAIFGLTQAEVLGRPLGALLKSESRKVLRDYVSGLSGPGLASVFNDGREVVATTREGNSIPLFLTISHLQSPRSKAAFCAVVRDVTPWKRTEQELRLAKEQAEKANSQKSDFLARISHELRTPLNAIMGFSEVMRTERFGEIKNDKYRAYANDIHDSGAHLLALINDLLDLSKVEAGKLELNFTAESIADATEHAMKLLQEEARTSRVLVRTAFPAKMPRVVADHRALRQIMLNLLSNAVKYTNAGGQVIVSAGVEADGSMAVRVKDTGIGMTDAQLQDALQPFTRVETADRVRQGTGLGLPLTKALTEANRAKLNLSSAPNQGTTAEIVFPGTRVLAE
jgi:PAS domain S-box-containing protein